MSKVSVYYNSACPVCNAGIAAQRRRMEGCNVDVEWIDIHCNPGRLTEIGASQDVGAEAFGALWSRTPRQKIMAALIRTPGIRAVAGWAYNGFAAGLYRWNRWCGRW